MVPKVDTTCCKFIICQSRRSSVSVCWVNLLQTRMMVNFGSLTTQLVPMWYLSLFVRLGSDAIFRVALQIVKVFQEWIHWQVFGLVSVHAKAFLIRLFKLAFSFAANFIFKLRKIKHLLPVVHFHLFAALISVGQEKL